MGKIKVLSEILSNKIAAGEVVERPASVVKELVENAIDAKSLSIFVSILEGGTRLIQIVDDGEGMTRDEVPLAFQRHATSKISGEADLNTIMTLGFRGEALPSIASISKISLTSKRAEASEGTEIKIEGGVVQSIKGAASPCGSRIEVRDLFYNVPARRKFLKSQQTEMSHISRTLFHLALSHPDIHFRLSHGGRSLLDAPSCRSFKERAYQLLGEKVTGGSMEISSENADAASMQNGLSLTALFSRPPLKRNFKKEQYIFVNLRPIKSALLTHAVYEAYRSYLMKGEEPFFILFLAVDPNVVDVNVHPAKREVRFQNTTQVHQKIMQMIREALSSAGIRSLEKPTKSFPTDDRLKDDFRLPETGNATDRSRWVGWPSPRAEATMDIVGEGKETYPSKEWTHRPASRLQSPLFERPAQEPASEDTLNGGAPLIRPIGQVYGTFLLAEIDGVLVVVDQHTAHERILYEELLAAWQRPSESCSDKHLEIQPLLIPQQIDLEISKSAVLKEYLDQLEAVGCKIESFGEATFLIRELPAIIAKMDVEAFLNELVDDLIELGVTSKIDQPIRTVVASMACHGAVRAHQSMSSQEIKGLLETYYARNTPPTCPHGRPIVQHFPLPELEKRFRRK